MEGDVVKAVEGELRNGSLTSNPFRCAEYRSILSGEYSYRAGLLEEIKVRKPIVWVEIRKNTKSDAQAERQYEMTNDGQAEMQLKIGLKRIEKLMQGLNSLIKLAEGQAQHGSY